MSTRVLLSVQRLAHVYRGSTIGLVANAHGTLRGQLPLAWCLSSRHVADHSATQAGGASHSPTEVGGVHRLPPHGLQKTQHLVKPVDVGDLHEATLPHPIWSKEELEKVQITHRMPEGIVDYAAFYTIQAVRFLYDISAGFLWGKRTEKKWLRRLIFLETLAGVPGMVGAMVRHLKSLRVMKKDHGWIHTLLEEAENERMHLMTFLQVKNPGVMMRLGVMGAQGIYVIGFSLAYLVSPRFCHRLVGYLEEEAVKTYTKCLHDIEHGSIKHWKTTAAPPLAVDYWHLPSDSATLYDAVLAIRADEAHHRLVNHSLASIKTDAYNPYKPGQ